MSISPNEAPILPLNRAQKQQPFRQRKLLDLLSECRAEMRKEGETQEWLNRILGSQANELFYRGFQKLRKAELGNTWRVIDPKPVHYTLNEFQFWINVNTAKWLASRVGFRVTGLPDDEPDIEQAARKLEQIARYYDERYWDRTRTALASKGVQFTAYLIAYVYYNPNAGVKSYLPVVERVKIKMGNDAYRCGNCGYVGEIAGSEESAGEPVGSGDDSGQQYPGSNGNVLQNAGNTASSFPAASASQDQDEARASLDMACANCGSSALDITAIPEEEFGVETGKKEYDGGDVEFQLISLYNIRFNARLGLMRSPVVLWEEDHDKSELEASYPGLNLPASSSTDYGLQAKANLEHIGREKTVGESKATLSRIWIDPSRYHDIELQEEIQTVAGSVFPVGTKLKEMFPKGLHAVMCGDLILDLYAAVKDDDLCVMEYHAMPSGGLAQGVDAMREPQRQTNTAFSLVNLWMRHHAAPPKRYNPELIDPGDMSGDPTRPIPINAENLGLRDGATIENAIVTDQPTAIPDGVFGYANKLREFIQFAAHATEFSGALPGVDNETFGGARIAQSLAQSVSGTVLAQFADFRAAIAERLLRKFRQYCWDDRYIQFAGQYGQIEKITLSAMDIPGAFRIETVPDSWVPRTKEQQQTNLQAMLVATGGWPGFVALPPEVQNEICETYGVRMDINLLPVAIRTARMRIKQMADMLPTVLEANAMMQQSGLPMVQQSADPMTGAPVIQPVSVAEQLIEAIDPPFNPREEGLTEAAMYLSKWFTTDEGMEAEQDLIEAVGLLQDLYMQGLQLQAMVKGGLAMAGQPMQGGMPSGGTPPPPSDSKPQPGALAPVGG